MKGLLPIIFVGEILYDRSQRKITILVMEKRRVEKCKDRKGRSVFFRFCFCKNEPVENEKKSLLESLQKETTTTVSRGRHWCSGVNSARYHSIFYTYQSAKLSVEEMKKSNRIVDECSSNQLSKILVSFFSCSVFLNRFERRRSRNYIFRKEMKLEK